MDTSSFGRPFDRGEQVRDGLRSRPCGRLEKFFLCSCEPRAGVYRPAMLDQAAESALRQAMDALDLTGLLFMHDARKPSLTAIVAGKPIRGSWWGHPAG